MPRQPEGAADRMVIPSLQHLKRVASTIRSIVPNLVSEAEQKGREETQVQKMSMQLRLLLATLKTSCQGTYVASDKAIRRVKEQKGLVEQHLLKLQNLLYEKNHLMSEIKRCRGFSCKELNKIEYDEEKLPITVEESIHQKHLQRLAKELEMRKKSQENLKKLKNEIKEMDADVVVTENFLEGLPPQLQKIEEATIPLQEYLGKGITSRILQQTEAQEELAPPLYTLYCEIEAYIDAFEDRLRLKKRKLFHMVAQSNEAVMEEKSSKQKRLPSPSPDKSSVMETPLPSSSPTMKSSSSSNMNDRVTTPILMKHLKNEPRAAEMDGLSAWPKAVLLKITLEKGAKTKSLSIQFEYLPVLEVITVEALNHDGLLTNLFPGDSGEELPNLASMYRFQKSDEASLNSTESATAMVKTTTTMMTTPQRKSKVGASLECNHQEWNYPQEAKARPYYWAQWIAGLYPMMRGKQRPEPSLCNVLGQIQKRWMAHRSLKHQLKRLSNAKGQVNVHESARPFFVQEVNTALVSFKQVTDEAQLACLKQAFTQKMNSHEAGLDKKAKYGCHYYQASFKNEKMTRNAAIEIAPEYPIRPPCFLFETAESEEKNENDSQENKTKEEEEKNEIKEEENKMKEEEEEEMNSSMKRRTTQLCDTQLRDIEREVNGFYLDLITPESEDWILSHQIRKIQMCFDIVSTAGAISASFGRDRRGKDRRRAIVVDVASNQCKHR